jgi:hypothetical protein
VIRARRPLAMAAAARRASLLGPPGSALRRFRLALGAALVGLLVWLAGPLTPWRLPGEQRLIPEPGQALIHTVLAGLSAAAVVNAALCALLLATSGFWARALPAPARRPAERRPRAAPALWLLVLAAAALGGALRWPLAHRSLWWDEAWSVRKVIVGEWEPSGEGESAPLRFDPASWLETLWYYRTPTNHVLYSTAARASLAGWRAATGAPRERFDEFALRLPAWLAAIASVVLVGLLVRDLGFPRAAPVAAFLLALHPWHVRFGADGRGYSFVVLSTLAGAWLLLRALRGGRWRDWLGFAASQWAVLWTFPLAVYVPLALGVAGALACAFGPETAALRAARFTRLAVAGLLAAMAYLQVMAPNLAQIALRGDLYDLEPGVPASWARHLWVYLATGFQTRAPRLPDTEFPTLAVLTETRPWLPSVVYGVLPALALGGLLRAWRRGGAAERAALAGIVLPVPLFLLHRELAGFAILHRFAVFGVAGAVPLLALGLEGSVAAALRSSRAAQAASLALGLAGYAALVAPELRILLTRPIEPTREVVALLARETEGVPGGAIRAGIGLGGDVPRVYDPLIREVNTPEALALLVREARAREKPLYVFYGYGPLNHRRLPELFAPLDDPRLFEPRGRLDGIESETVFRVLRYTGEPLP